MPSEVKELREQVEMLERKMESMAELVGELIDDVFGNGWTYDSIIDRLKWTEYVIPGRTERRHRRRSRPLVDVHQCNGAGQCLAAP